MGRLETKILGVIVAVLVAGCILAVSITVYLQKSALYEMSTLRAGETAGIVAKNIEHSMLEGKPELTKSMVLDFRSANGIEDINVYNNEGRAAFSRTGPVEEWNAIEELRNKKDILIKPGRNEIAIYKPLINTAACQGCHGTEKVLLGAVKIVTSMDRENRKVAYMLGFSSIASVLAIMGLSTLLIFILRRVVIRPVHNIENAAALLADGDLSFPVDIRSKDEIGRLSLSIRDSLFSISGIVQRVREVSDRISRVAGVVESESRKVLEGTQLESDAIENISSSVEELNASIVEISEGTDSLAASIEETAASMEQMSVSISQITQNTSQLFTSVEETSSSIEQMSSTIRSVAESADRLAVTSENTLSAMEELNSSIKEVDRNAKDSASLSHKVVDDATTVGLPSVEKTVEGMRRIKEAVENAAESIRKLGARSEEIGKILTVIDEITEQTTLLSLNAAILASQAGEYGKGFSVVADEIKDLAERTSFSTQEIASLINSVQAEVHNSVRAMDEGVRSVEEGFRLSSGADEALKKIVESAKKSSESSSAIERATEQQSLAINLVSDSMEKVKQMISGIARATSEQKKGAALIMTASERVRDITTQVKSASEEQAASSQQISKAMEIVSDKTQQISLALREQKEGVAGIKTAIEKIVLLPAQNRERAFTLNKSLKDLSKDADLVITEMQRFRLQDLKSAGVISFGVVPLESPAEMYRKFNPLINYLSSETGRKMELKVAVDFASAVNDLSSGVTQLCYMTPSTYIQAHKESGAKVVAKALRDGRPFHHSVIIANDKKRIEGVGDLKGKSFAFGDVNSTSSHIVPRFMLSEAGVELDSLLYYNYLGRHEDVAEAVLAGDFDAGGVMESTALRYRERGLKLIKYSEEIPEFNVCASRALPKEDLENIVSALLKLNAEEHENGTILRAIDRNYTGFTEARDGDYDGIREIMQKLEMI